MRNTRLSGHGLLDQPWDWGLFRAVCSCGEESPVLPTTAARKRWHAQEHKPAIRAKEEA